MNIIVAGMAIRLFSIWLIVWVIRNLPVFWIFQNTGTTAEQWVVPTLFTSLAFVVGCILWKFPLYFAGKIIPKSDNVERCQEFQEGQIVRSFVGLLGVWVLVTSIPSLIYFLTALYLRTKPYDAVVISTFFQLITEILLGLVLVFKKRVVLKFVEK